MILFYLLISCIFFFCMHACKQFRKLLLGQGNVRMGILMSLALDKKHVPNFSTRTWVLIGIISAKNFIVYHKITCCFCGDEKKKKNIGDF